MIRPLAAVLVGLLGAASAPAAVDWPGGAAAQAADRSGTLGGGVSGLTLDGTATLWAVRDRGALLHLEPADGRWAPSPGDAGERELRYPDGRGTPDAEAVTTVAGDTGAVYVGAERSNAASDTSRNSVLRFDTAGAGPLTATREWKLDTVLGPTPANTGVESLTWIADADLVAMGFRDEAGTAYAPTDHGDHGGGVFAIAVEGRGEIVFVALRSDGQVDVVGRATTGLEATMELSWNAARQELWAVCDNRCDGQAAVLRPVDGAFRTVAVVRPPAGLADRNDEGFTLLPTCTDGTQPALWAEDASGNAGTVLRQATLPCTPIGAPLDALPSTTAATVPSSAATAPSEPVRPSTSTASTSTSTVAPASATGGSRTPWYVVALVAVVGVAAAAGALAIRLRRR